jgi:hypothetical protein
MAAAGLKTGSSSSSSGAAGSSSGSSAVTGGGVGGYSCPQHRCTGCDRSTAAAGGLLFR